MMPHREEDEDEEDWDDAEAGDDPDDGGEEPTVPCPYCRCEMLEDSPHCPACGRYISAEDQHSSGKPLWIIATALICLGIAIWSVFAAF